MRIPSIVGLGWLLSLGGCCLIAPHTVDPFRVACLDCFKEREVTSASRRWTVYQTPKTGAPILLLHELPGLSPQCLGLAERLADAGYTVYMPLLFGRPGERSRGLSLSVRCASRDYNCVAGHLSPITEDLKPVIAMLKEEHPGRRLGVIGMCLTGNLPLGLLADPAVNAVVLSQPALPVALGPLKGKIGLSQPEITKVQQSGVPILVTGFSSDCIAPVQRLQAFKDTFGEQVDLDLARTRDHHYHAVLTDGSAHREARRVFAKVVAFLDKWVAPPLEESGDGARAQTKR